MRENEMRMRVFQFLKARLRNTLMPATVSLGLAVGGCTKEGLTSAADTGVLKDTNSVPVYSAVMPADANSTLPDQAIPMDVVDDSGFDGLGRDTPVYGTPDSQRRDTADAPDQGGVDSGAVDGGHDVGIVNKYGVPIPRSDASADSGRIGELYAAVIPTDARVDLGGIGVRYGAQVPDAS
jgi:hypothetical protein